MTPIAFTLSHWSNHCKEYVARITGPDEKFKFSREFVRPSNRRWSRSGKNGYTDFVVSVPGLYEIQEPSTGIYGGQGARRYFRINEDGATESVTFEEALAAVGSQIAKAVKVDV